MSHALRPVAPTPIDLQAYFEEAARPRSAYHGQLEPEFQEALARLHLDVTLDDCDFNQTVALANGELVHGDWDLRDSESRYLGGCRLAGKRVIEYGPACGAISTYICGAGAELVVFDRPLNTGPEFVPQPNVDLADYAAQGALSSRRLRNAWWFVKRQLGLDARAVYADIYDPPDDLGRFDIAVFGLMLGQLSNPFCALQRAAEMTNDTIVVTDVYSAPSLSAQIDALRRNVPSLMVFNPSPLPMGLVHWWALSPEVISHMLRQLGFSAATVTTHSPSEMASQPPLFTVVAHRLRPVTSLQALQPDDPAIGEGDAELPVPPPQLRFMVAGTEDFDSFLLLGQRAYNAVIASLERARVDVAGLGRVLDFGCGVGRVTRYWKQCDGVEVFGTDLYEQAIQWNREHLTFATFNHNALTGPLPYPDGHFGLVYALSVFTHLPPSMQMLWFEELVRVLRPGGLLYFTTHGQHYAHMLDTEQLAAFEAGQVVVVGDDQPGSNHCAAFHPPTYVMNDLLKQSNLTLVEFVPNGARGNPEQDSYLLRKATLDSVE